MEGAVSRPQLFLRKIRSIDQRNQLIASDYTAEFRASAGRPFLSRLCGLDVDEVRVVSNADQGDVRMRGAWHENALSATFFWGDGAVLGDRRQRMPQLLLVGPATDIRTEQAGRCCILRVGVRGATLDALRADPETAGLVEPWLRPGVFRPHADPAMEWRLQEQILLSTRFVERALEDGIHVDRTLGVIAKETVGRLLEVLAGIGDGNSLKLASSRQRIVTAALDLINEDNGPISVSGVCRQLGVSERTLQRAFQERLGVGLHAYERQRRLRGVHAAILAEGNRRTITEIAMNFGFWHLGRFAGAYKAMFGCSPTETRRRVWSLHRSPELILGEVLWPGYGGGSRPTQPIKLAESG
jgi:AraC family ethanolamine operon transcriptional activator